MYLHGKKVLLPTKKKKHMPEHRFHVCKDGSHTVYSEQFGQFFHNPNGAVSESKHIFFELPQTIQRLEESQNPAIFETGFGTGLNFLLLADAVFESSMLVSYFAAEAYPLSADELMNCNHRLFLKHPEAAGELTKHFRQLKTGENVMHFDSVPNLTLHLFIGRFEEYRHEGLPVDVVFYDAFSPAAIPELWTPEAFSKVFSWASENVVLATFCASSKARAAMAKAGWLVARAPGALGKREMTIASKQEGRLRSFKRVNEQKLIRRFYSGD